MAHLHRVAVALLFAGCVGGITGTPLPFDAGFTEDAGSTEDAGTTADAGTTEDAGTPDAGVTGPRSPVDCSADAGSAHLACTGLYSDWPGLAVSTDLTEFVPGYSLWSDGTTKRRWARFPPGTRIDTSNPLEWDFPTGTRLWKEFSLNGVRVETRMLSKRGPGDWEMATFRWRDDESAALRLDEGELNVRDSGYEIPAVTACAQCHGLTGDVPLGLDPVLVSAPAASGLTAAVLNSRNLVTTPLVPAALQVPGNAVERAALGYLHANCGVSCHRAAGAYVQGSLLRLEPGELGSVQATDTYQTSVNVPTFTYVIPGQPAGRSMRIASGGTNQALALSAMHVRMASRVPGQQMPQLATRRVDTAGLGDVERWIRSMLTDAGYPAFPDAGTPATPDAGGGFDGGGGSDGGIVNPGGPDGGWLTTNRDFPGVGRGLASGCTATPPALKLTPLVTGLDQPTFAGFEPGDSTRLYILERTGRAVVRDLTLSPTMPVAASTLPTFFNLNGLVVAQAMGEAGLLSMAFHPNFASNNRLFVSFNGNSASGFSAKVVQEYRRTGTTAAPLLQPLFRSTSACNAAHIGGHIEFGPDGLLYYSTGELCYTPSTPPGVHESQATTNLTGKLLRYDVNASTAPPATIVHLGLRNPWRFGFDRTNGDLFIGDVGGTYEKVIARPATSTMRNLGWGGAGAMGDTLTGADRLCDTCPMPATSCAACQGITPPIAVHNFDGTIIMGFVYRGSINCMRGRLVYGMFYRPTTAPRGSIRSLVWDGNVVSAQVNHTADLNPGSALHFIPTSIGQDSNGEIYVVHYGSAAGNDGVVYRVDLE